MTYEEYKRKRQERDSAATFTSYESYKYNQKAPTAKSVIDDLHARVQNWFNNNSTFMSDYTSRFSNRTGSYGDSYVNDAKSAFEYATNQKQTFDKELQDILAIAEEYKDFLSLDYRTMLSTNIKKAQEAQNNMLKGYSADVDYWSQWKDENAYKEWVDVQKQNEEWAAVNIEGERGWYNRDMQNLAKAKEWEKAYGDLNYDQRIADLEIKIEKGEYEEWETEDEVIEDLEKLRAGARNANAQILRLTLGKGIDEFEKYLSEKNVYLTNAERYQKSVELASVVNAPDFEEYAQKGEALGVDPEGFFKRAENQVAYLRNTPGELEKYKKNAKDFGNEIIPTSTLLDQMTYKAAAYMKNDEFKIYNYYFAKDKDKAKEYLESIEESLNSRQAAGIVAEKGDNDFAKIIFGVEAGLDNFRSGVENLFSDKDYYVPSAIQMAGQQFREDLGESNVKLPDWLGGASLGQSTYDLLNTGANMAPSILASIGANLLLPGSGAVVGNALMGASAGGNAYAEMINAGYTKEQAKTYGKLVAASESLLQYFLGGISALGGKLTGGAITNMLSKIDKAYIRVGLSTIGNMASEGLEEGLQSVLEPWFKSVATNTDFEAADIDEVLYSGLLGALSAGVLENLNVGNSDTITGATANAINKYKSNVAVGKRISGVDGAVNRLVELGSVQSADSVAYKVAEKINKRLADGKKVGAYTIAKLFNAEKAALTEANVADITKSLTRKGVTESDAKTISAWMAKAVEGVPLTEAQANALENNPLLDKTFQDVIINPNSTVYQRTKQMSDFVSDVNRATTATPATDTAKAVNTTESATTQEDATESKFKASVDGKTVLTETAEEVKPVGIESIKNGSVKVKLENGKVVDASELAFATKDEAVLYDMVSKMDISPESAMALIKNFKATDGVSAERYAIDAPLAYKYGTINYARGLENITDLTPAQRQTAYYIGQNAASAQVKAQQAAVSEKSKESSAEKQSTSKEKGNVRFEKGAYAKTREQKRAVKLAQYLAKAIGIDIVFYDATTKSKGENGYRANGYFDEKTDTIYLDLQNATDDTKTIVFTMSHELTHFIKKWSLAKFKVFADFLMEQYGDTDITIEAKMEQLGTSDPDLAYEELIADACETMLLDSNAVVKLMQLRENDLDLSEKIKLHVLELVNKIRTAYKNLGREATTDEAQALLKMEGVLEKLSAMFEDAAVDAAKNYQAVESLETDSVSVSEDGTIRMQMKQYQQTGRATLLRYLVEQYGNKTATDLISTIDNIYNVLSEVKQNEALSVFSNWQDTEVELDENGHPIFTTSVNNGDYELNQDFSRVCKKRRQLDFVLNMLAEDPAFEASNLTKEDFVKINKAIKKHGFEIACALCFVDSKRFRQAEWADSFANTWNDILNAVVKDGSKLTPFNFATKNPNIADDGIEIDTSKSVMYRKWSDGKEDVKSRRAYESLDQMLSKDSDGKWLEGNTNVRTIATLIRDNPELRHTFRGADIIGSQGFDTIQRLAPKIRSILDGWGGSSVPKPSSNDASYDSSIINMSKYNKETAYAMGGVRMNSFSDFMAHMFFDYCQAFADLSAKELPSQAYTKELDYVRLFGRSGQKQNMSGIAAIRDNALPTIPSKTVTKAEAEANEKIEKMIAGLDVSRLLEHLNKDIYQLTESDVEQFLDMCDYVWADESINMKHATLLQTGILYDKLSESKIEEIYELLKAGEVEQALNVAGEENVDREYAKHCGTIVVGVSDAHIRKLLRDPTIRMVIPYHKSGLNPVIARELRIAAYNDYTLAQTTGVKRKGTKTSDKIGSSAIKDAYGLKDFAFYDWFGKTIDGKLYDGKATADKYLDWCENGYYDERIGDYVYYTTKGDGYILASEFHKKASIVPKFDTFASEENYYKLLEDFDCYDTITGEHSDQGAVDFLRNGLPSDYKDVLVRALKEEQKVSDDFKDHLDNKGLKDEVMEIVKARGYTPSEGIKMQAKKKSSYESIEEDVKKFATEINRWVRDGKQDGVMFILGSTGDVLQGLGAIESDIYILGDKIKTILNEHPEISISDIKKIPQIVGDPVLILKSRNVGRKSKANSRLVIFGTVKASNGNHILSVLDLKPVEKGLVIDDMQKVNSVYTKTDPASFVSVSDVVYADKKRTTSLLRAIGFQMPIALQQSGYIGSISYYRDVVNIHGKTFSEVVTSSGIKRQLKKTSKKDSQGNTLSEEQTEFFKDSKVRDTDGNLLVAYHVTPNEMFYEFDSAKHKTTTGTAAWGKGFYFSDEKASYYWSGEVGGKNTLECYLNITNPFIVGNGKNVPKDLKDYILSTDAYKESSQHRKNYLGENATRWYDFLRFSVTNDNPNEILQNLGYDGIIVGDNYELVIFNSNQAKLTTNKTPTSNPDIRFQMKKPSNRAILTEALEGVAQNDIEKNKLAQYKAKIDLLTAEEQKLQGLRAEIKELSFAKGPRDTKRIRELQDEATKTANRINIYDRQLLSLEATTALKNVLEREKARVRKAEAQKGKEALKAYREKAETELRDTVLRYQESRHKAVEGRRKTEERHAIAKIAKDLDKLLNHGTKERNVKKGASDLVRSALDLANMYFASDDDIITSGIATQMTDAETKLIEKYAALYDEYHSYDDSVTANKVKRAELRSKMNAIRSELSDVLEREKKRINDTTASGIYDTLIKEYKKLSGAEESYLREAFDQDVVEYIEEMRKNVGNNLIGDMTLEQLKDLHRAFTMIKTVVQKSNKLFGEKNRATIAEQGESAIAEIEKQGHKATFSHTGKLASTMSFNNLKPIYLIERTKSKVLQERMQEILDGESIWAIDMEEGRAFMDEAKKKHGYDKWDFDKAYEFETETGLKYSLTLGEIFSIYAYSKRGEQALNHLRVDGFVFDKTKKIKNGKGFEVELNDSTSYAIDDKTRLSILGKLTAEQRAFIDETQKYLSEVMGEKGNEVSREMYGIDLFGEENYFPLRAEGAYLERAREQANGQVKYKNRGFTKATQEGARNSVVLSDYSKVWAEHVAEMSGYHAFTLALENFYKVYNYQNKSSTETNKKGVIPALNNAYGDGITKAIGQLLIDLNGGARSDPRESPFKTGLSLFKKAKTMFSLSVIIQQPSSLLRAQAMIDAKYFVGFSKGKHKDLWNEIKKYAPVAVIKEMGSFDVGMGRSSAEWLLNDKNWREIVDDFLSKGASYADEVAWIKIWNAVKRETLHTEPTLKPNSEEFLKKAGQRFEDIIRHTQVYDSTLSRSGNMRSKSGLMQIVTAFLAEPTTAINMREMALRSGDKNRIIRTTVAVYASTLLNAVLVALPYAMRDDDEDETFIEKYATALTTSFVDSINPLTSLPFIKDIYSMLQGYDIKRSDMALADDLINSFEKFTSAVMDEEKDKKKITDSLLSLVGDLSSFTGLPVDNAIREVKSIVNFAKTLTKDFSDRDTTWLSLADNLQNAFTKETPIVNWFFDEETKTDKLYDAIMKGDKAYADRIKGTYKTEASLETAMRKALREHDSRIKEAAEARIRGDIAEYARIVKEITAEGRFVQDIVVGAINTEINAINKATKEEPEELEFDEATSIYRADDINAALESGDIDLAKEVITELISVKSSNNFNKAKAEAEKEGKRFDERKEREEAEKSARSTIKSSITRHWKSLAVEAFKSNDRTELLRIRDLLFDTGLYGRTRSEVYETMMEWRDED